MPDHDALPPGSRFGEFEIVRVLGVGGFGIVYLAHDHSLERYVALKEYMPASLASRGVGAAITVRSGAFTETYAIGLRSFVNEARLLARFDHPSLVKVYRFWEDNATAYMVMPYLQGITLRDARRSMAQAPDELWIRAVLNPMLDALELLHREGVFHRDIAPDNILLPPEGQPILLDFGAARRVISDRTQSLTAILKPSYAPIEQYAEMTQLRQGPWTDLYALGAVLHFLLFGAPPPPATARALQDSTDVIADREVPGVSRHFLSAVAWMLEVRPANRPQNVEALRAGLDGRIPMPVRDRGIATVPDSAMPAASLPPAFEPTVHAGPVLSATTWTDPANRSMRIVPPGPAPVPAAAPTPAAAAGAGDLRAQPTTIAAVTQVMPGPAAAMTAPPPLPGPAMTRPALPVTAPALPVTAPALPGAAPGPPTPPASVLPILPPVPPPPAAAASAGAARALNAPPPSSRAGLLAGALVTLCVLAGFAFWQWRAPAVPAAVPAALATPPVAAQAPRVEARPAGQPVPTVDVALPPAVPPQVAAQAPASPSAVPAPVAATPPTRPAAARVGTPVPEVGVPAESVAAVRPRPASRPTVAKPVESPAESSEEDEEEVASPVATPLRTARGPATAREACGTRVFIAMAMCMERECALPRFRDQAECVKLREAKTRREP